MLGFHMSPIYEAALLFQAMSPKQKQTTLCVQNPNCTQLCHEAWASQCTQSWDQLCKTDSAFSCPLLKTGVWECLWASVWMHERGGGLCVQEIKNSSAPQPADGGLLEAGKGTSSPGRPPPPRHCGKLGGLRNMEEHLYPGLSMQRMDC